MEVLDMPNLLETPYRHIVVDEFSDPDAVSSMTADGAGPERRHSAGARITGVDLSQPLSAEVLAEVRSAWVKHGVVCFPGQPMTHAALEQFTLALGPFGDDPYIEAMPDHPNVLELRRNPDEKAVNFGAGWHSDWSFQAEPPAATLLHAKVVPPVGGDTLYADGAAAYDALSSAFKTLIGSLRCTHSARRPYGLKGSFAGEREARTMRILPSASAEETKTHPLVRTHPESGRKALFINPVYTLDIVGLAPKESQALLGFLFEHMVQDAFVYRHHWQVDMLTVWDNRRFMHLAEGGYDGHLRVLHRTTVAGDVPA